MPLGRDVILRSAVAHLGVFRAKFVFVKLNIEKKFHFVVQIWGQGFINRDREEDCCSLKLKIMEYR